MACTISLRRPRESCASCARAMSAGANAPARTPTAFFPIPPALFGLRKRIERVSSEIFSPSMRRSAGPSSRRPCSTRIIPAQMKEYGAPTPSHSTPLTLFPGNRSQCSPQTVPGARPSETRRLGGCTPTVHLVSTVEHIATAALFDLGIDPSAVALCAARKQWSTGLPGLLHLEPRDRCAHALLPPGLARARNHAAYRQLSHKICVAVARARCRPDEIRRAAAAARCAGVPMPSTEKD